MMKHASLLSFTLLCFSVQTYAMFCRRSRKEPPKEPTVVVNINNSNTNAPNQSVNNSNTTTTNQNQEQNFWAHINNAATINFDQHYQQASDFLSSYKWYLIGGGICAVYTFVCYYIIKGNKYLSRSTLWSSWHPELSLDELHSFKQTTLADELVLTIQQRYTNPENPTDFLSPLAQFMRKTTEELKYLRFYKKLFTFLHTFLLTKLLPINVARYNLIPERINRLLFFRHIFTTWAAAYNVSHNRPG